jgi:tRNA pseudouridine38-40 synthase
LARYKLILEYDGTGLIGWQENSQGPSVQALVQDAVYKFRRQRAEVVAAGRTDAGVHALGMVCHFDLESGDRISKPCEPRSADYCETIRRALNFYLHDSPVSVLECGLVPDDFHARFSARRRNYRYIILNRGAKPALNKGRVWWVPRPLDVGAMRAAAAKLVGNHDFSSFRAAECQAKSPVKTLDKSEIVNNGSEITIDFSARSFLHHQVRNMVGTLVGIGLGKPYDIDDVFAAKSRAAAGPTAPAGGLYFVSAEY